MFVGELKLMIPLFNKQQGLSVKNVVLQQY